MKQKSVEFLRHQGFLKILKPVNSWLRSVSSKSHELQHKLEWTVQPVPEWYDTFMGQHYRWQTDRCSWIWDRGVFNTFAMRQGACVLDICCGGGFFTYHFYSGRASSVVAIDFDPDAIAHAKKYNSADNIRYELCDIRQRLPDGPFDHVVWDGAIEHFTPTEIDSVIERILSKMKPAALFSGYTIQERNSGGLHHPLHEYEFSSKADLARFFDGYFKNVVVFETIYPDRHNLHWIASNGVIPFMPEWQHSVLTTRTANTVTQPGRAPLTDIGL